MENKLKLVTSLLVGILILMAILISGNQSLATLLAVYIAMILISLFIYSSKNLGFKQYLFGIRKENLTKSILWGIGLTVVFYVVAKATGLTIGLPNLPNAIGDSVRKIIVLVFAPVIETIFFQSIVFAYAYSLNRNKLVAIILTSILFAVAHVSAYVTGFYSYPTLPEGLQALGQNIGAFVSAFIFSSVALFFQLKKGINNLAFTIIFHAGLNTVITLLLSVVFL